MKFAAAVCSLTALALLVTTDSVNAAETRTFAGGRMLVTVGGTPVTTVHSVDGGGLAADVVKDAAVPTEGRGAAFPKKHPGPTHVEPLVLEIGSSTNTNSWISEFLNGSTAPRAVAESMLDFNYKEQSRVDFPVARLTQIDFAALDGASKDALYTRLTLQPDSLRRSAGSSTTSTPPSAASHAWVAGNFRVTVGTLPCARVASVAPITVKGGAGGLSVSNLILTISAADQKAWTDWQEAMNKGAEGSDAQEKSGSIEYLAADMRTVVARISLKGLGLIRVAPPKQMLNNGELIERFTAEMYIEDIKYIVIN